MKKELLIASALVSTLGAASVANAVTSTMSGELPHWYKRKQH